MQAMANIELGEYFNTFLKQIGYIRNNDLLFMEDITEEEYDALQSYLEEYRSGNAESEDE